MTAKMDESLHRYDAVGRVEERMESFVGISRRSSAFIILEYDESDPAEKRT